MPEDRLREIARQAYGSDPDGFIEKRDRLARQARDDGDRELAKAIGRLRKPTLPAWAVDQLALRRGEQMQRLFRLGDAARGALQEDERPVRDVMAELRDLVAELRDRAGGYLEDIGSAREPHLDDVERTLTTVAVDPGQRADVAAGTLARPLAASGFEALGGLELGAQRVGGGGEGGGSGRKRRRLQDERRRLQRRTEELRQRHEDAQRRAEDLRSRADAAQAAADEHGEELGEAEKRLREIIEELSES